MCKRERERERCRFSVDGLGAVRAVLKAMEQLVYLGSSISASDAGHAALYLQSCRVVSVYDAAIGDGAAELFLQPACGLFLSLQCLSLAFASDRQAVNSSVRHQWRGDHIVDLRQSIVCLC